MKYFLFALLTLFTLSCSKDIDLSEQVSAVNADKSNCTNGCANNASILLVGLDNNSLLCLNYLNSYVGYDTPWGVDTAPIYLVNGIGYIAYLPFSSVCPGSPITLYLEKFPKVESLCDKDCFQYDLLVTTQGQGGGTDGPERVCIQMVNDSATFNIGFFNLNIAGTNSCIFAFSQDPNFGVIPCETCL